MGSTNWSKQELLTYLMLYIAHSDLHESRTEYEYLLSRVDAETYGNIKDEFDKDNDYQSISKIVDAVRSKQHYNADLTELFADIKLMAFADGTFDHMENATYNHLKKILS
ncbi:hypothetical protein [Psychroserpens sp.]|uniref:hypothetical protein n=1 Tax=Psychroserpens sp. TaxID=2020870 RepID=UPI001B13D3E3|nr:hypothetical protein [Psychroserpens sp.]MBO6606523.1 hypothetical protein [Psychroserpens sp.]MBO6631761.1 hypothetical protein [Psychroserpens sp.]MBO6653227.1 hypothetical protein [Psychroserpens sp.]MBO6680746.1 hypothetical protein [Psychroserpens sp.]MBO6750296.1 hypothetical protein [Psychroserpens sp.]